MPRPHANRRHDEKRTIRLPNHVDHELENIAHDRHESVSELLRWIVYSWLREHKKANDSAEKQG